MTKGLIVIHLTRHRRGFLASGPVAAATWLAPVAWCAAAWGQAAPTPRPYGVEVAFRSGHADRGFVISDGPVVQPVVWVTGRVAEFSVWSSFAVAPTTDGSRPRIVELELTRERQWKRLTIAPAIRMYFYQDPSSIEADHSMEGWLHLSYDVGPFRLFTRQSLDVLTYRGAYFGQAGIESQGRLSPRLEVGGSLGAGWASSSFNEAYAGIARSALDRLSAEGWLAAYVMPCCYVGPHFEFSTIVDPGVRGALAKPTYLLIGLSTGVEF